MKKLERSAFGLLLLSAILIAGFTWPKEKMTAAEQNGVQKNKKPSKKACTAVVDGKTITVGYATDCEESENSNCTPTRCPDKAPDKDMKILEFRCVDNRTKETVAYASGCITSVGSYCIATGCPVNTSAVSP